MATLVQALRRPRPTSYGGIWGWITTVDHKRIGALYGAAALFFFFVGGLEALLIRLQLARPENAFVTPQVYNQLFTMHALTMVFLAIMPLSAALFNLVVPLMIGARDVAFPRLNALSFWVFFFAGIFLNSSFILGGAPDVGWFAYANLTAGRFSPGHGVDFYTLGLLVAGVSSIMAALNFIVTIVNLRAPGMTLMRMPVFVWMTLVTSFLIVMAFPAITVGLILLTFDRLAGTHFFMPEAGGDPLLWQHLFWIFGHPEVYILILPAFGIVSEVLPVFSRKPLFGYPFVVLSGVTIGILGFGVWAHHMFSVGLGPVADSAFAVGTMLIAIPTGVKIFNWLGTMVGGAIDAKTPFLFAVGLVSTFVIGGLSGVMHASPPADLQQTDSYFVVAHFHYVLFGGSVLGLFAGIYYWFPKLTGRLLDEGLGRLHFWLMFIGLQITFFPMHIVGILGMPRRIYTYQAGRGWDFWNLVETVGAFVLAAAMLLFVWTVYDALARRRQAAPADPWDGATLEWSIPSPPPPHNFDAIPRVTSRSPLWDLKHGAHDRPAAGRPASGAAAHPPTEVTHTPPAEPIHLPLPSFFPFVVGLGLALIAYGVIFSLALVALGVVLLLGGIYGMVLEPIAPAGPAGHAERGAASGPGGPGGPGGQGG